MASAINLLCASYASLKRRSCSFSCIVYSSSIEHHYTIDKNTNFLFAQTHSLFGRIGYFFIRKVQRRSSVQYVRMFWEICPPLSSLWQLLRTSSSLLSILSLFPFVRGRTFGSMQSRRLDQICMRILFNPQLRNKSIPSVHPVECQLQCDLYYSISVDLHSLQSIVTVPREANDFRTERLLLNTNQWKICKLLKLTNFSNCESASLILLTRVVVNWKLSLSGRSESQAASFRDSSIQDKFKDHFLPQLSIPPFSSLQPFDSLHPTLRLHPDLNAEVI